ncbi:unnamed protein product [Cuscuta campestris]|uniref:Uncharacterized protein n=1 Tax=Cuscuta campestris TaxID=132261 RepID=A0A484ME26_9ASTE|nr:unnamed protein product [Cuscuta campestris]
MKCCDEVVKHKWRYHSIQMVVGDDETVTPQVMAPMGLHVLSLSISFRRLAVYGVYAPTDCLMRAIMLQNSANNG